ncbi:ribosome-associated ATPase/putative transporter RbbA [Pseudidiomarina taiwanensis]|uniref:Multidrug ABC transporter ATP-binding protein n=1 Tax=Pseudidiomarina taiwanensis TaxID=337250 RepID=A0A432ZF25_9GAMM|nr:ribosome-associated ATPase/putative transporter RbbA [Pseudidiomarina taiwanensis]RUO76504.1 multidrug ABC transporter ATP-binding protein [Pseudidiomarina taiwanensis]
MTTERAVDLQHVCHRYGDNIALDINQIVIERGAFVGLIGPDGVGKSTLLSLLAGARQLQSGELKVLGLDINKRRNRHQLYPRIAYMPQGLGKNLYPTLSVAENLDFFARLFGHGKAQRQQRIAMLLQATGLSAFADRPAGKLSGGMKQKLGLCCALIHDPELLILDEPTTGVDPLSRRQFWQLIAQIRQQQPQLTVIVATAYMAEASQFDHLFAMHAGRILAQGAPQQLCAEQQADTLEQAFLRMLPGHANYQPLDVSHRDHQHNEVAIEAHKLSKKFGDFTAVDNVDFTIHRGEIFGFLGSNGCGKTTTMKMLTGLLEASSGSATLLGQPVQGNSREIRRRVGYMTQQFSLYTELTVEQNLYLHGRLYDVPQAQLKIRVEAMLAQFELRRQRHHYPKEMPLGERQRLSLAVAMIHQPEILILDEPTSGVDPIARDQFWRIILDLAKTQQVTIFISTHFMDEAERCDRISLMHEGRVLVSDTPPAIIAEQAANNLDDAFIRLLEQHIERQASTHDLPLETVINKPAQKSRQFSLQRLWSYSRRESLELKRDPIRLLMAGLGSLILMFVLGYGINMDVNSLTFAVLDRDQTQLSRSYTDSVAGSRYFVERPALHSYAEIDQRMRAGELSLALEIPTDFAKRIARGETVQIGAWIDGAMPVRAETVQGYVQGLHQHWLLEQLQAHGYQVQNPVTIATRFRYNPDVASMPAMMPAVIPLLLLMFPAILTSLSVVREKELGSILNFYVTPTTRLEFLLGKQLPYLAIGTVNFFLLLLQAEWVFGVPLTGSFWLLTFASVLYVVIATAFGFVVSAFVRSQIAALFVTMLATMVPATTFSGMITPVPSLEGIGRWIGEIFPATYEMMIARGVFSKALGFAELGYTLIPLLLAIPIVLGLGVYFLPKQER